MVSSGPGSHRHDWHSTGYVDDWVAAGAERDHERAHQLRQAVSLLPYPQDAEISVLDVGAGYGEFTAHVLEHFPNARVCLHDFSIPMLEHAKQRLVAHSDRTTYVIADLTDPEWTEQVGGPFDAVVSALTIHNLAQPAIRRVYTDIFTMVRPGGCFYDLDLLVDVMLAPAESPLVALYSRAVPDWNAYRGTDHHHQPSADGPPGLADHLGWLRAAGFDGVDCVWKHFHQMFLCGLRASTP